MSNNKQSSVEWLYNKMYEHRGNITIEEFEQAKAMHKEEIKEAFWHGTDGEEDKTDVLKVAELYYRDIFGGNNDN